MDELDHLVVELKTPRVKLTSKEITQIKGYAFTVVEADPLVDEAPGLEAVGKLVQIDSLVFERAPQPLDEDVVQATAPAVHRNTDTGRLQAPGEGEAGELAALIGVENLRLAMALPRGVSVCCL